MILCDISEAGRYRALSPLIAKAIDWIKVFDPSEFETCETSIGDGIVVKAEAPGLLPRERVRLEVHERYIDIHVPLKGTETMGWARRNDLILPQQPYQEETDIGFYGDQAQCLIHVRPGQMAIFFPEDAHAPCIGIGTHRKLCVKIPVI
ncbi:MAG: YhcH/YjgK/YiaL family protein [Muribaculaceae bacterium]|nr:YhcH/YjgK/YiaL family protein [Muribaculaceae bacterium]